MADVGDLLKGIAAALWVLLALLVFLSFRRALNSRLPFLTKLGLTPSGVAMEFAQQKLAEAVHARTGQQTILFTARFDPLRLPDASDAERLELARTVSRVVSGRTNRYDEVLHLILDTLERTLL